MPSKVHEVIKRFYLLIFTNHVRIFRRRGGGGVYLSGMFELELPAMAPFDMAGHILLQNACGWNYFHSFNAIESCKM